MNHQKDTPLQRILQNSISHGQLQWREQRPVALAFEPADERFAWITDRGVRVGLFDRSEHTVEWLAPHPGRGSIRPIEIPDPYHAPTYQGGRIILQWWVTCCAGWRVDVGQPLPETFGIFSNPEAEKKPTTTWQLGPESGDCLTLTATHVHPLDDRIRGEHRAIITYDPLADSYVVEAAATLTAPDPYFAEFCNVYAAGLYDTRPDRKRFQNTIWSHPDGRFIRWPHNPVSYLTPGMNDYPGRRRISAPGFLGYFSDPYTNPVVEILAANHPTTSATCCNLYDEHLSCLPPTEKGADGVYHWEVSYRSLSVPPEIATVIADRAQRIDYGADTQRHDAMRCDPEPTDRDIGERLVHNPLFPAFYYGRVNDFEQPLPYNRTVPGCAMWASANEKSPTYWDDACGHSAARSIRLRCDAGSEKVSTTCFGPTPHFEPNTRYRISGWIRCEGCVGKGAAVRFNEVGFHATNDPARAQHVAGPVTGTCDWTYVEDVFTTGEGQLGWLYLDLDGEGMAWFDDVAFEECTD